MIFCVVCIWGFIVVKVLLFVGVVGSLGSEVCVCGFDFVSGVNMEWYVFGIVSGIMICFFLSCGFGMSVEFLIILIFFLIF